VQIATVIQLLLKLRTVHVEQHEKLPDCDNIFATKMHIVTR